MAGLLWTAGAWRGALSTVLILSLGLPFLPQPAAGQPSLPDISVSVTDISISNSSPMEDEPVFINATVHVSAATQAEPATVELLIDGKLRGLKDAVIDPNYTVQNISFEWWTRSGHHNVTIVLDPANEIAESDEGNNAAGIELDVRARPVPPATTDWPLVLSALFFIGCAAIAVAYLYRRSHGDLPAVGGMGIEAEIATARATVHEAETLGIGVANMGAILEKADAAARVGDVEIARTLAGEAMRRAMEALEDSFAKAASLAEARVSEAERAGADVAQSRELLAQARSLQRAGEHGRARALVTEAMVDLKKRTP